MTIMYLFGAISFIVGICVLLNYKKKKREAIQTTYGVVTGVTSMNGIGDNMMYDYYPTIDFYIGNERITVKSKFPVSNNKYKVGQKVLVHYNPNNPTEFYIDNNTNQKIFGIVYTIVGIAILVFILLTTMVVNKS